MLQVCLNGARSPREHHHLPVRPEDLARAAAISVAAGARDIHLHPKAPDGTDSLEAPVLATTLRAVRAAVPGTPIGIPTGVWTIPDPRARITAIRTWTLLPDHASVNWHEHGADEIATALLERGIGLEAGLHSGTGSERDFLRSPLRHRTLRVLATITDRTARGSVGTARTFLQRLAQTPAPILLHGQAAGAWPVLDMATRLRLDIRIGLEDTLQLPDGSIATDNAELVTAALDRNPDHKEKPR
ncbi:3-keto-5-aminohexanoate cleavage protein [Halopolyspora algeriensis]|nr:3-keto-5-aminohexanoate cleavage protein [Halopolyspora algeriensis]